MRIPKVFKALLLLSMIAFLSCESSDKNDSINLTGWWYSNDADIEYVYISHDSYSNTVIMQSELGDDRMKGLISGNTITWSWVNGDSKLETIVVTYNSNGQYLDGQHKEESNPDIEYFKLYRADDPFIKLQKKTITIDGNTSDWGGIAPQITDPGSDRSDCSDAANIESLTACLDGNYLVLSIDLVGNAAFPHSGYANDKYRIMIECPGNQEFEVRIISNSAFHLYDEIRGESIDISTGNLAIAGDQIECRIDINLLRKPNLITVKADTWSDGIHDCYDETGKLYIDLSNWP